jgi:hypothetical protein
VIEYKTREDNCVLLTFVLGGIGDVLGDLKSTRQEKITVYYLLLSLVVLVMF